MARLSSSSRQRMLVALVVSIGTLFASEQRAPTSTIPENQLPLLRTFRPASPEQSPPGTGKFVIFTREEVGKEGEWDFIAGVWECNPSRPDLPPTKRAEFCHSSWEAGPLLDCLVGDGSEGRYPRFVRLQVDSQKDHYDVNLYDIDYRTWDIRCIWQGHRLSAFGVLKGVVLCHSDKGWFSLDAATGAIRNEVPFTPLEAKGAHWLVRKLGEKSGAWSYDIAREQFVAHFGEVETRKWDYAWSVLSSDGRNRAWVLAEVPKDFPWGCRRQIKATVLLQREGRGEDLRIPVEFLASPGSGNPLLAQGIDLRFTSHDCVEFEAATDQSRTESRVWTIELKSGQVTVAPRAPVTPPKPGPAGFRDVPAPEYLMPRLEEFWAFGRSGLAPAFLVHMGILDKNPSCEECITGVSLDGWHVLYTARLDGALLGRTKPQSADLIYGDLKTKRTLRWARPAGIELGTCMTFAWVETP